MKKASMMGVLLAIGLCICSVLPMSASASDRQKSDADEAYMQNIAEVANAHVENAFTFLWVTDTHVWEKDLYIGDLVAQMTKRVPCEFVAHTGDIVDGLTTVEDGLKVLSKFNDRLQESDCPVFYVKGNHDDNCLYARKQMTSGLGKGEDYILTSQLYARTNAFHQYARHNDDMYFYYDDEESNVRSIFLNSYDYTEECDENGIRMEDAHTEKVFRQEQLDWLEQDALNFTNKEAPEEWGVILFSHEYLHANVYRILGDFQKGLHRFADQGKGEVIAWFVGDDHLDMLSRFNWVYDAGFSTTRLTALNASTGYDNYDKATTDNKMLCPPRKVVDTENETAFDLVSIDRENHLIYLTRYGARSYAYNPETDKHDIAVARTRVVDYTTGTYKVLTEEPEKEPEEKPTEESKVLRDTTFEKGTLSPSTGEEMSSAVNIRSNMLNIAELQATDLTAPMYHFAVYSLDDAPVRSATLLRYTAEGEFVNALDMHTIFNEQYGYPTGAMVTPFSYNKYTPIKQVRFSVDARNSARIRVAIYRLVDDVPELIAHCDVDNLHYQVHEHRYDSDIDPDCNVCGYVRKLPRNGWILENGKWYYYKNDTMLKNTWQLDSVGWCYLGSDGAMRTNAWIKDSVGWCYVGDSGYIVKSNWVKDGGKWYYLNKDGYMLSNTWQLDSVGWCYLGADGAMKTNAWIKDSVGWCYVGADGYCITNNWVKDSVGWVYLDHNGRMLTNSWVQDSVGWCYVGKDGYAVTKCWKKDSIGWCYLDENGSMTKSDWVFDGGCWYYLDSNGYMVTGTKTIDGKTHTFYANGVWAG